MMITTAVNKASYPIEKTRLKLADLVTKVNSSRGAPMGRRNECAIGGVVTAPAKFPFEHPALKVHLRKVPLDSGGYDQGGAYWGLGTPLYVAWACAEDLDQIYEFVHFLRTPFRGQAKLELMELNDHIRFYK